MKLSTIRKSAAVICAAILGVSMLCPVGTAFAQETKAAASAKSKTVENPEELTHNTRFDSYTKLDCIDVSAHQGRIDWPTVAGEGVDAAIIRVGYRTYDKGEIKADTNFVKNMQGAHDAGLQVGVYFYTQATNPSEAAEEARFVLSSIQSVSDAVLSLPVYIDIEHVDNGKGRQDAKKLSPAELTAICNTFCDVIAEGGYQTGIYSNRSFMEDCLQMEELEYHSVWLAMCGAQTSYKGKYDVWQYSHNSRINGIKNAVARSVIYTLTPAEVIPMEAIVTEEIPGELPNPDFSVIQFATETIEAPIVACN